MNPADHALETLLWSETTPNGDPLDRLPNDPSPELIRRISADWQRFREQAEALGFDAEEHRTGPIDATYGDAWDYAAHDFILTRNHHGTGFWDSGRWAEPWGDRLTALCATFGGLGAYIGDDGLIYPESR